MLYQQYYILTFVAYPTDPRMNWEHSLGMSASFLAKLDGRFIKIHCNLRRKKLHRTSQVSNILVDCFTDNVRAQIQLKRDRQSHILKDDLSSIADPPIFISIAAVIENGQMKQVEFSLH